MALVSEIPIEGESLNKLDFVDSHIHFWDFQHPDLRYEQYEGDFVHPQLGERFMELAQSNYLVDDYIVETRNSNVIKAVHVQAAIGIEDPVKETEWLQQAAGRTGFPQGIIAHASLKDPDVAEVLERHCEYPNMRGVRDFSTGDYLVDPAFHRGYALLDKFNLIASLDVKWPDMQKERDLAIKFPNTRLVLDHAGFPTERTVEYFQNWQSGIRILAEAENVVCKISGLGMCDWDWTVDSIRPWVMYCIETFGIERCIFATNWPVDKLFSDYDTVINAYSEIISEFSEDEQVAMFSRNAEELYRI